MIRALYTAASGMSAQQMNLDTIANNLANSSTTGFRQLRLESTVSAGLQIGLGTKSAATEVIMTQGSLNQTSNPLDVAIEGAGFFQIQRPDGTIAYTRAGQFQLNSQGTLVTTDGDPLGQFEMIADIEELDRIRVIGGKFEKRVGARREHAATELDRLRNRPRGRLADFEIGKNDGVADRHAREKFGVVERSHEMDPV